MDLWYGKIYIYINLVNIYDIYTHKYIYHTEIRTRGSLIIFKSVK